MFQLLNDNVRRPKLHYLQVIRTAPQRSLSVLLLQLKETHWPTDRCKCVYQACLGCVNTMSFNEISYHVGACLPIFYL